MDTNKFYKTEFGVIVNLENIDYVDYVGGTVEEYSIVTGDARIYISEGDYKLLSNLLTGETITNKDWTDGWEDYVDNMTTDNQFDFDFTGKDDE